MLRNNLAKLMIDRGISATQLFNDTGIARSTISKISNNKTDKISIQTIDKLCNYLNISPSDFFDFIPFEINLKAGFENFDSLDELMEGYPISNWPENIFLIINVIHSGKKMAIEYQGACIYDSARIFKIYNIQFELYKDNDNAIDLIKSWPIQFQNELLEQVRQYVQDYFDSDPTDIDETITLNSLLSI